MYENLTNRAPAKDIVVNCIAVERANDGGRCAAGVFDAIQPDAKETVGGETLFASADEYDFRIRWSNYNCANGKRKCGVHERLPGRAAVNGAVETTLGSTDVSNVWIGRMHRNRDCAAANWCGDADCLSVWNREGTDGSPIPRKRSCCDV